MPAFPLTYPENVLEPLPYRQHLMRSAARILRITLRSASLVGWLGLTLAPAFVRLALLVYAGPNSVASSKQASSLLSIYAGYTLLLAWNGPTEAFLNAAMSQVS
ncbi:unnamed protein product [Protopolystoma xenopodis]|uniref:Protein RFT1 homolog n=1 Tax=Protopolystoma xenopodis TaxID=117903 RepID=A0A3S5B893_9PLAT|nr:unnamed protein product [Protopolystoma xenopodis]